MTSVRVLSKQLSDYLTRNKLTRLRNDLIRIECDVMWIKLFTHTLSLAYSGTRVIFKIFQWVPRCIVRLSVRFWHCVKTGRPTCTYHQTFPPLYRDIILVLLNPNSDTKFRRKKTWYKNWRFSAGSTVIICHITGSTRLDRDSSVCVAQFLGGLVSYHVRVPNVPFDLEQPNSSW